MSGYINLHRQLLDSSHFANPDILKVWIWMLLRANYKDCIVSVNTGQGYTDINLQRGQFIFGRTASAKELKMSESKIYRLLKKLENNLSITVKSNNKFSIVTICKYDDYNGDNLFVEQQANNKRTTSEQQANTDNKYKKVNKVNNRGNKLPLTDKELFFLSLVNEVTGRKYQTLDTKTRNAFSDILKNGHTSADVKKALKIALTEMTSRDKQNYLTPEFITRPAEFEKYVNMMPIIKIESVVAEPINHDNR